MAIYDEEFYKQHAEQIITLTYLQMNTKFGIPTGSANTIKQKCYDFLGIERTKGKPGRKKDSDLTSEQWARRKASQKRYYEMRKYGKNKPNDADDDAIDAYDKLVAATFKRDELPPITNYQVINLYKLKLAR